MVRHLGCCNGLFIEPFSYNDVAAGCIRYVYATRRNGTLESSH